MDICCLRKTSEIIVADEPSDPMILESFNVVLTALVTADILLKLAVKLPVPATIVMTFSS